ncbi:MAG: hypothetical protein AAGK97_06900 [Bacteroidota bacterium]
MFKSINLFYAILFSVIFLVGCSKDSNNNGINVGDGCNASWELNGQSFEEDLSLCVFLENILNLSASSTGGTFQLQIDPISTTGSFQADPSNPDQFVFISIMTDDGKTLVSNDVNIEVTRLNQSSARGNFSGSFFDITDINQMPIYNVNNGSFSANF